MISELENHSKDLECVSRDMEEELNALHEEMANLEMSISELSGQEGKAALQIIEGMEERREELDLDAKLTRDEMRGVNKKRSRNQAEILKVSRELAALKSKLESISTEISSLD